MRPRLPSTVDCTVIKSHPTASGQYGPRVSARVYRLNRCLMRITSNAEASVALRLRYRRAWVVTVVSGGPVHCGTLGTSPPKVVLYPHFPDDSNINLQICMIRRFSQTLHSSEHVPSRSNRRVPIRNIVPRKRTHKRDVTYATTGNFCKYGVEPQ